MTWNVIPGNFAIASKLFAVRWIVEMHGNLHFSTLPDIQSILKKFSTEFFDRIIIKFAFYSIFFEQWNFRISNFASNWRSGFDDEIWHVRSITRKSYRFLELFSFPDFF